MSTTPTSAPALPSLRNTAIISGAVLLGALCVRAAYRRAHAYDFSGKVVLITGGSRGLGLVLARQLLAQGARVFICARHEGELDRAFVDLQSIGSEVGAVPCDVTSEDDVERVVRSIEERWGPVDVLINNAGVIRVGPLETMTKDDYRQAVDVHVWGPLNTMYAVLPAMRRRGCGRIVNIASIGGLVPVPHLAPYCTSKFALVGLSQSIGVELAKEGIAVTTVCPGLMRTGSHVHAEFKGRHRAEHAWFSVGASTPILSQSAEHAASAIIDACRHGRAQLTLALPAKAADFANTVAPGVTRHLLSAVNRLLPRAGGIQTDSAKGFDSRSRWSPSILTRLSERAAERNNELASGLHS